VARTEYAELLGWPVAAYAGLFFLAILVLLLVARRRVRLQAPALALVALLAGLGLLEGLYLIGIQALVIETWCLLCLALDVLLLGLVIAGAAAWPRRAGLIAPHAGRWARWALRSNRSRLATAALGLALVAFVASGLALRQERVRRDAERVFVGRPVEATWMINGPSRGADDASVTIVMFSDYLCPSCGRAAEVIDELLAEDSDVRLVHQDFPLDALCNPLMSQTVHPLACWASLFAQCAGAQGRYWEFHDQLFARQASLTDSGLKELVLELNLNPQRFESCINDQAVQAGLSQRIARAGQLQIQRTPTLFINGYRIEGNPGLEVLRRIVELARAARLAQR
jgi:protein-disulfide isomerase